MAGEYCRGVPLPDLPNPSICIPTSTDDEGAIRAYIQSADIVSMAQEKSLRIIT
jgi:hypothetical protein